MTKLLLGLAIIAFTTFVGYLLTKKYRKRKIFFTQFYDFNHRFLNEIAYFKRPVGEFISKYTYKGEFDELLKKYTKNISTPFFMENLLKTDDFSFLTSDEKRIVIDYFLTLGKGNTTTQTAYYNGVKESLNSLKIQSEKENKRYGDLFIKLGFLCGLFILILII